MHNGALPAPVGCLAPMIVRMTVRVVPATAIVTVIGVCAAKWTPGRRHHGAGRAPNDSSDRAANDSSAEGAGRRSRSLDRGCACDQSERRQRHEQEFCHSTALAKPVSAICSSGRHPYASRVRGTRRALKTSSRDVLSPSRLLAAHRIWRRLPGLGDRERSPTKEALSSQRALALGVPYDPPGSGDFGIRNRSEILCRPAR
jgi:hypothetical protein